MYVHPFKMISSGRRKGKNCILKQFFLIQFPNIRRKGYTNHPEMCRTRQNQNSTPADFYRRGQGEGIYSDYYQYLGGAEYTGCSNKRTYDTYKGIPITGPETNLL
jgi:hypothetical protein